MTPNFMEQSPSVGSDSCLDSKNFLCFKKFRGSSQGSDDPTTKPCALSGESLSQRNVLSLKETSGIHRVIDIHNNSLCSVLRRSWAITKGIFAK